MTALDHRAMHDRRALLQAAAAAAFASAWAPLSHAAEPAPETTRLRLSKVPSICLAPQYVAESLLRAEGFTQIEYVGTANQAGGVPGAQLMGAGDVDIGMNFAGPLVIALDMGVPITLIGGVHVGCFELFATNAVRSDQGPQGQDGRDLEQGIGAARVPGEHRHLGRARSEPRHRLGRSFAGRGQAAARRGQDRRLPRLSARPAGTARAQGRPRPAQQRDRPAVVAVLLLPGGGQRRVRAQATRSPPSARCARSSRPASCAPPTPTSPRRPSSRRATRSIPTMRGRRSPSCRMAIGATTSRPRQCASTRCACARPRW